MKASDFSTSTYLNALTAGDYKNKTLVIYEVKAELVREKRKLLIGFESVDKGLIVNKTNREILTETWGDETDNWIGKSVVIDIVQVMFEGKRTPSIMLIPVTEKQAPITDADTDQRAEKAGFKKARK